MSEPEILTLNDLLLMRLAWKDQFAGRTHPSFREYSVYPTNEHPNGQKGLLLANAWNNISKPTSDGLIICDGDVVIDPSDYSQMLGHIVTDREAVWTAPVRLWPIATQFPEWIWAHRKMVNTNRPVAEVVRDWQEDIEDPEMFSFCFTYLPRRLMEGAIKTGLKDKIYPGVDWFMWDTAKSLNIPVKVVRGCYPKHLNY